MMSSVRGWLQDRGEAIDMYLLQRYFNGCVAIILINYMSCA